MNSQYCVKIFFHCLFLLLYQNLLVIFRGIRSGVWWCPYPSYSWRRRKAVRKHVSNLTPSKTDGPRIWLNYDTTGHTLDVQLLANKHCYIKGTVSRDFCFRFFPESSSPKPLKITFWVNWSRKSRGTVVSCCWYQWCTLPCEYLRKFMKKIRNDSKVIFNDLGEDDSRKKLKQKISRHCPFKKRCNLRINLDLALVSKS